jgi:hypothetical protein
MIEETLNIENSNSIIRVVFGEIIKSEENKFHMEVCIFFDNRKISGVLIKEYSSFRLIKDAIWYVGNQLRAISRTKECSIDLDGLEFDSYIPLPRAQREIWDEV